MALQRYLVEEVALDRAAGLLTRREAMRRLGLLGVSAVSAAALLAACGDDDDPVTRMQTTARPSADRPTPRQPPRRRPWRRMRRPPRPQPRRPRRTRPRRTEPRRSTPRRHRRQWEPGRRPGRGDPLRRPARRADRRPGDAPTARGAVLVIHENRGLTPHIRSIPPRLAADGYTALAIDLLSEEGGTASCRATATPPRRSATHPQERLDRRPAGRARRARPARARAPRSPRSASASAAA